MSKYQEALLQHIEEHPDFILPQSRRNEVISFIKQGLQDLSISRNTFSWGIPIEFAPGHITYVWFDALTNYLTAVGYENNSKKFETYWNHARVCHLIGKDIIRFHAIIWPCMLLSAGIKLPDSIVVHGWWTSEGEKCQNPKEMWSILTMKLKIRGGCFPILFATRSKFWKRWRLLHQRNYWKNQFRFGKRFRKFIKSNSRDVS